MLRARMMIRGLVGCAVALVAILPSSALAEATPTPIPADADWLTTVNYFREMSGLAPVTEDAMLSDGSYKHSCYMVRNGIISHDQVAGLPGYTPEGHAAGQNGNVAVSSSAAATARSHIELWMTGPFHAIGVLRPNLERVGFGKCADPAASRWRSGATLDVLRGRGPAAARTSPVLFPGNGSTTSLNRFIVETPDPRPYCGYPTGIENPTGLPIIALMPEAVTGSVSASVTGPNGPLQTCAMSQHTTDGVARNILAGDNAIVAIPRFPLSPGTYTVTVSSQARNVTWTFTVDPAAADGAMAPAPTAAPSGPAVGFQPISPARVVDTRQGLGATRLEAGVTKTIQIGGRGGVPSGASAVSANFTIVGQSGGGYLTVWNCAPTRPVVSTVNFSGGEVAPNAATVPLDGGRLCVFSTSPTDLVIDVNGYYAASGTSRFTPVAPARLMDSRIGLGAPGRLVAGQTVELQISGKGGVPNGVSAATLNVTSTDAATLGYISVYPCDGERPVVSNLNPTPGRVRPNLVVTPLSSSGSVCLYTLGDVDLVVDVTGYLSSGSLGMFTPTAPFRFIDTRDRQRIELNGGTGGTSLAAGETLVVPIAGRRGVPSNATAVSLNLTVTDAAGGGYITAWPCGTRPTTSTANYSANVPVANGAQLPLSADGSLCVFTIQPAHIVIDVNGWWS